MTKFMRTIRDGKGRAKEHYGFGEWHTMTEWAILLGLTQGTLQTYLSSPFTIEEIVKARGIEYPKK